MKSILDRLLLRINFDTPTGCWEWTGGRSSRYAIIRKGPQRLGSTAAHRAMYEIAVGPIPEGLTLDHLCRNTFCLNPDHLEPVDIRTNILRGTGPAARNHRLDKCQFGHEFKRIRRQRVCPTCRLNRQRELRPLKGRKRQYCPRGHEMTGHNRVKVGQWERCRICRNRYESEWAKKQRRLRGLKRPPPAHADNARD